jgi:Protein of unknown function (DUF3105)
LVNTVFTRLLIAFCAVSKKLERKQQRRAAEEQRKRAQQRAARKRNLITGGIIAVVAAIVVGAIYFQRQEESEPVGVAAQEAGCTGIEEPEEAESSSHVPDGTPVDYATSPPTSGEHYATPADASFYSPQGIDQIPPEQFVHNHEHGQVVLWYSPDAPDEIINDIEGYVDNDEQQGNSNPALRPLLATPYEDIDSPHTFVITAWDAMQSCTRFSEEVVNAFREEYQGQGPENPQIPMPTFDADEDA